MGDRDGNREMRAGNWKSRGKESHRAAGGGHRKRAECAVPVGDRPTEDDGTRREVKAWREAEEKRAIAGERRRVREE